MAVTFTNIVVGRLSSTLELLLVLSLTLVPRKKVSISGGNPIWLTLK